MKKHLSDLSKLNGHSVHKPSREEDINYLAYVGNGYFGLAFDSHAGEAGTSLPEENLTFRIRGQRTLSVTASYKPYIEVIHLSCSYENNNKKESKGNNLKSGYSETEQA